MKSIRFTILTGFISSLLFLGGCYWLWFYEHILVDSYFLSRSHLLYWRPISLSAHPFLPTGFFDAHAEPPPVIMRAPSPTGTLAGYGTEYKRSGSTTVVEGGRSGDVWSLKGVAVN